jgi:predicted MFS family arabinose efflux permease
MAVSRAIPLGAHAAIETVAAPAIMAAPLLLGFSQAAAVVAFIIGALLLGLAVQAAGPRRTIPLSAHAGLDYTLAAAAVVAGLVIGIVTGAWDQGIFLVGVGVAQVALTASTRFSVPAGA